MTRILTVNRHTIVPLDHDISVATIASMVNDRPYRALLTSVDKQKFFGRFTVAGLNAVYSVDGNADDQLLRQLFSVPTAQETDIPFGNGIWIGYLSYDAADDITGIRHQGKTLITTPPMRFSFHDTLIVIDHAQQQSYAVFADTSASTQSIQERKRSLFNEINRFSQTHSELHTRTSTAEALVTKEEYIAAVNTIKRGIYAGDFYQIDYTYPFVMPASDASDALFTAYIRKNPVDYAAFLHYEDLDILSISPECFFTFEHGVVTSYPIKGTIKRGATEQEDILNRRRLLESEKDRRELSMIVDLIRNDIGKVAKKGSVFVKNHASLEQFSTLYHLYSAIEATVPETQAKDLLLSLFPGGSITGAPKLKSMEVIASMERYRRGIYTGSIGWIAPNGAMGFNIAIRTVARQNDSLFYYVGGGIVADSDPEAEYHETITKAASFWNIFEQCEIK